jgi:hypothetical protein
MFSKTIKALTIVVSLARAYVLPETTATLVDYGLYATYEVPDANILLRLHAQGFHGTPNYVNLDLSNWHKTNSPLNPTPIDGFNLKTRDVCAYGNGCLEEAADSETNAATFLAGVSDSVCQGVYSTVLGFWSDNNYTNVDTVIQGSTVYLAFQMTSTTGGPNTFWNFKSAQTGGNDGCGLDTNKPLVANYLTSSVYDFCMAAQQAQSTYVNTFYVFGQLNDNYWAVGNVGVVKNYVAAQQGTFGPTCNTLGVGWKRP